MEESVMTWDAHRGAQQGHSSPSAVLDVHIEPERDPFWVCSGHDVSDASERDGVFALGAKTHTTMTAQQTNERLSATDPIVEASDHVALLQDACREGTLEQGVQNTNISALVADTFVTGAVDVVEASASVRYGEPRTATTSSTVPKSTLDQEKAEKQRHQETWTERAHSDLSMECQTTDSTASEPGSNAPNGPSRGASSCGLRSNMTKSVQQCKRVRSHTIQTFLYAYGGKRAYLPRHVIEAVPSAATATALVQERSLVALSFMDEDSDAVSLPQVPLWSTGLDIGVSMKAQQLRTSPRRREAPGSSRGQGNKRAALLNTSTLNRLTCIDYSETEKLLIVWPYDRWPYLEAFLLDTQQQTTNRCLIQTPSCWQTLAFHSMNQIKAVLVHGTTDIVVAGPMARIEILSLRLRSAASIMGQDPSKGIEMPSTAPNDASGGHILNRCVGQLVKQADLRLPTLGEIVSLAWTEDGHSLLVLVTSGSCYVLKQSAMQSVSNRLDPCTAYPTWSIERRLDRVIMEQNGDAEAIDNPWPHRDGLQTRQNERFPLQSRAPFHESPVGNSEHQLSSGWPRQIPLAVYGGRPKQVAGTDASTSTQSAYLVYTSGIASVDLHTKRCSIAAIPKFMPLPKSQGVPLSLMNREPLLASCSVSMTQSRHRVPLGTCLLAACTPTRLMLLAPQVSSSMASAEVATPGQLAATGHLSSRWDSPSMETAWLSTQATGHSLACLYEWPVLPMRPLWRRERRFQRLTDRPSTTTTMFWLDAMAWPLSEQITGKCSILVLIAVTGVHSGHTALVWASLTLALTGQQPGALETRSDSATRRTTHPTSPWCLERASVLPLWVPLPPPQTMHSEQWDREPLVPTGLRLLSNASLAGSSTLPNVRFLLVHSWSRASSMQWSEPLPTCSLLSLTPFVILMMPLLTESPTIEDRRLSEGMLRRMRAARLQALQTGSAFAAPSTRNSSGVMKTSDQASGKHRRFLVQRSPSQNILAERSSRSCTRPAIQTPISTDESGLESWAQQLAERLTKPSRRAPNADTVSSTSSTFASGSVGSQRVNENPSQSE